MTDEQKELIGRLIKAYRGSSTELLIGRITGTDGMLEACRKLLNNRDTGANELKTWLQHRCEQAAIDEQAFLHEIRTIIEMFSPHTGDDDPYQVLGLTAEAGPEQIKRAYRKLSLQYHPDTAPEQSRNEPDQFIKITRAYQALLGNNTEPLQPIKQRTTNNNPWRQKKQPTSHSPQRKKVFAWTLGLLILLMIVSFIAATNYRKKTMIAGLQHSRGAFIPPPTKTVVAAITKTTSQSIIEQQTPTKQDSLSKTQPAPLVDKDTLSSLSPATRQELGPHQQEVDKRIDSNSKSEPTVEHLPSRQEVAKEPQITLEFKETEPADTQLPSILANQIKVTKPPLPEETKKQTSKSATTYIAADPDTDSTPDVEPIAKAKKLSSQVPTDKPPTVQEGLPVDASPAAPADVPDDVPALASVKAETSTEEYNSEETYAVPLEQRLRAFFDSYLEAYNERNILTFSRFFAVDAVENDKPFATMVQTYLELFQNTDSAILEITDLDWNKTSDQIEATGRFNVNLHYDDGHQVSGTGPITFQLLENGNSFQISRLKYHFEH